MEEMSVDMKITPALNKEIEKDSRVLSSLSSAISRNTLLSHLSPEDRNQISECMFLCTAKAGEVIIRQGDQGDNFYIIEQGKVTIQVLDTQNEIMNFNVAEGGSFGELALIYGTPRAATVKAASDIILYGMTRESFRKILLESAFGKRKKYEDFISHIPILEHLDKWQRLAVVDLLQEKQFPPEETVVKQGEDGEMFFFIIEGQAKVTMFRLDGGEEQQVNLLGLGDFFGELALLNDKPRAATVTAISRLNCAVIDKDVFERGLAPCSDMFKQQGLQYKTLPTNQKPKK